MPACQPIEVSSAWQRLPKNTQRGQRCKNAREGEFQLTPWHSHPLLLPPSTNRPKVQITTFSPPHNRHRTIVGNHGEKSSKDAAYLVRIVHCSPLSCKRFQKRKIQLKSFLSFHFLATFLCVLLQLKLSTGVLVPSAGLAAATAWDRPADELQQLPPPISCRHDCAPPSKSTECRTNFPPNWRRIELPVLGQHFIVEMFLSGSKFHLNCQN